MAVNTTTFESTLQTKLNDTTLVAKEMLLLGKALEATVGSIAVSDINTAGATKVSEINAVATNTFKTVGGTSILGSGDIATLPSQSGASGKVLKSDGTNAAWGTDEGGKLLNTTWVKITNRWEGTGATNATITVTPTSASSTMIIQSYIMGETSTDRHDMSLRLHSSLGGYISDGIGAGQNTGSMKLSEGGYTSTDYASTPGNAFHQAMEANTSLSNITYTWYVTRPEGGGLANLSLQGSGSGIHESSPSWILVMEVE